MKGRYSNKTNELKNKYLNPYLQTEAIEETIHKYPKKSSPEITHKKKTKNAEIQVENNDREDDSVDIEEKGPRFTEGTDSRKAYKLAQRFNQDFENIHLDDTENQKLQNEDEKEYHKLEDPREENKKESPEKSLNEGCETMRYKLKDIDDIDRLIAERHNKIIESRKDRESRLSYTSRGSDSQYTFSNSKNLFLSSTKQFNKYEMHNDSFGSPDAKKQILKRKLKNTEDINEKTEKERKDNNDHIIRGLESQERMIETFIPPSRIEPVPLSLEHNDLSIAYQSSPDIISYQYEDNSSPPKCKMTRKKLFHSPTHKKERKEDGDPEYICNPDTASAMRAKDLH